MWLIIKSLLNVELQILSKINNYALHCTHIDKMECNDFLLSEGNRSNETLIIEPILYQNIWEILFTITIELFTLYIIRLAWFVAIVIAEYTKNETLLFLLLLPFFPNHILVEEIQSNFMSVGKQVYLRKHRKLLFSAFFKLKISRKLISSQQLSDLIKM